MTESCFNCRYHHPRPGYDLGECHKNPPSSGPADHVGYWPFVAPTDWCGAFEASVAAFEAEQAELAKRYGPTPLPP